MENCDIEEPVRFGAHFEMDHWCEFCGDERPCECDSQLSQEWDEAAEVGDEERAAVSVLAHHCGPTRAKVEAQTQAPERVTR